MPTSYPDVDDLLSRLLPRVMEVLAKRLLGVYIFGSVVTGDYDENVSDVDLLVVVGSEITRAEFDELEGVYASIETAMPRWNDRIEVLHVSKEALQTFREQETPIAVISPGEPLNVKPAGIDWLMNWWMVRELGVTLHGPPPSTFIAPISDEEYRASIRAYAREFPGRIAERGGQKWQSYITLSLCRSMYTSAFGGAVSKQAAANWTASEFPQWAALVQESLVARRNWRQGEVSSPGNLAATRKFAEFALERFADDET
ncbi:MAG: aminoglycoside adenylyltransferase domain-containing protein [Tepidiformaceae bacterium]